MSSLSLSLPYLANPIPTKLHLPPTSLPDHRRHPLSPAAAATFPNLLTRYTASTPVAVNPVYPAPPEATFQDRQLLDITVAVVGSTGYIGNFVVRELVRRGFNVVAVDVVVVCLPSRSGGVRDSFLVNYQATANSLALLSTTASRSPSSAFLFFFLSFFLFFCNVISMLLVLTTILLI